MRLNLGVQAAGDKLKGIEVKKVRNLKQFLELLNGKGLPSNVKAEIIKEVSQYPEGAINYAWTNLESIITTIATKMATPIEDMREQGEF